MAFDKSKFMMNFKGKPYLTVAGRVVWFRQEHPDWGIETVAVEINHEKQFAVFQCRILNEAGRVIATATKKEDVKGFADFLEKAETGSIGRALGLCGYGTDGDPDFDGGHSGEETHIVDTPQPSRQTPRRDGPPVAPRPPMTPASDHPTTDHPACDDCGKPLTQAQAQISARHYGKPLCPTHQQGASRREGAAT